jgi:hypothetical protein
LALVLLGTIIGFTPTYQRYAEQLAWQGFEQQIRMMQHRALMRMRYDKTRHYLYLAGTTVQLDNGIAISLPDGWHIAQACQIEISRAHLQAGKVQLMNQTKRKAVVFQLGGGTFDIQG